MKKEGIKTFILWTIACTLCFIGLWIVLIRQDPGFLLSERFKNNPIIFVSIWTLIVALCVSFGGMIWTYWKYRK